MQRRLRRGPNRGVSHRKRRRSYIDALAAAVAPKAPGWAPPAPSILHRWCDTHGAWHQRSEVVAECNVRA